MKVECKKIEHIRHSTECKIEEYCCKKMRQVFNKKYKRHFSDGSGEWSNAWRVDECGVKVPIRMGDYSECIQEYMYLVYCPFCGELIE